MPQNKLNRRKFIKRCTMGGLGLCLAGYTLWDLLTREDIARLEIGFPNDAPAELWKWSREAAAYEVSGSRIRCVLCPHECILGENDRGYCRVRVVKNQKLHTLVYGNPCSVHVDPMEKKPLFHFLPGTPIFSIATAGCNLRCLNCQNWEISQAKPKETRNFDLMPSKLVDVVTQRNITSIAYTYSDPIIFYEYVLDTAKRARNHNVHNVLVTAGYIFEKPLRALCRWIDAANIDLKGFTDGFYKKFSSGKLQPVLDAIQIMREEGVWIELTRLVIPTISDDMKDIRNMCNWIVNTLGPDTPLHISRFHPAFKMKNLHPTPRATLNEAWQVAKEAGLHYVYVGNLPGHSAQNTICPSCGEVVIERRGYRILSNRLDKGHCACGKVIQGVWK